MLTSVAPWSRAPSAAILALTLTLTLVLAQPRGLSEAWAALLGAGMSLLFGLAVPGDVFAGVRVMGDIRLILVSVMVLAGLAERAGVVVTPPLLLAAGLLLWRLLATAS